MKGSTEWRDKKSFVLGYWLGKMTCKKGKIVDYVEFDKGLSWILSQVRVGKATRS